MVEWDFSCGLLWFFIRIIMGKYWDVNGYALNGDVKTAIESLAIVVFRGFSHGKNCDVPQPC